MTTRMTRRRLLLGATATTFASMTAAQGATANVLDEMRAGTAVPGMAAITFKNFGARREIVSGVRRLGSPHPIERGDRWAIGSNGKAMTATLIARLCAQGVLSWTEPLERMLPDLAASMHESYRDVTLPDLLSHRSGMSDAFADVAFLVTFVDDTAPYPVQRRRYVEAALSHPPETEKRATPLYSNSGIVIAGAIAERATGTDYETLMRTQIFEPLRMRSPTYERIGAADENVGHVEGRIANQRLDPNPRVISPSDGARLSLHDWSAFCLDQMRGSQGRGRLMHGDFYRFMQSPQGGTTHALGWMTAARTYGRVGPTIYHSGSDGNWIAEVLLFPHIGDGVLVTANSAYGMDGNTAAIAAERRFAATLSSPADA